MNIKENPACYVTANDDLAIDECRQCGAEAFGPIRARARLVLSNDVGPTKE